ncbi:MAG: hypothetical protein RR942_04625 [Romboutsia sp.]|nr:hypothetical protein [Paraclostridium benzoelyticum]
MKITVKNKEFDSGKLLRSKYKKYTDIKESLMDVNKETYTDDDLDKMVSAIVKLFDNQFTEDDINDEFEISDIIFNFMRIELEIAEKLNEKIEKTNTLFMIEKK